MSLYLQQSIDGKWVQMLDDPEKCRLLIDDVCCCRESEYCADWPPDGYCSKCPHFEAEEVTE